MMQASVVTEIYLYVDPCAVMFCSQMIARP
jgi:hypothetical protein